MSKGFDRIPESFAGATRTRKLYSPLSGIVLVTVVVVVRETG
jgi:hypothetical protein